MAGLQDITAGINAILSPIETLFGLGSGGVSVNTQYSIFMDSQGTTIQFPVMPEEISVKYPSTNQTYNLLSIGEIVRARLPGLAEYKWESFFPAKTAPWINTAGSFKPPEFYINTINDYKQKGNPIRLIISRWADGGKLFDTNTQAVVEDFEVKEKGGEVGDFYYSISLKEYRPYTAKTVTVQTGTAAATPAATVAANSTTTKTATSTVNAMTQVQRATDKIVPLIYTVRSTDTLWKIAKGQLNDGSLFSSIMAKNGLKDVNSLRQGLKLRLPS